MELHQVELPESSVNGGRQSRSDRSDREASNRSARPVTTMARGTQQMRTTNRVRRVFKSPERRTFAGPTKGSRSHVRSKYANAPLADDEYTAAEESDDVDMEQEDVIVRNAPALPKPPMFKGSTKAERRVFMSAYDLCSNQTYALSANGLRPFVMPVCADMDFESKYRIVVWDLGKDPDEVTEEEWVAWFRLGFEVEPRAFESLKKRDKMVYLLRYVDSRR
ncbi:hypothetical protein H310_01161 [Aphanomyces invadans]|uniref:Uncharacterized protein n=1 Tax=Aphanomyces invadans TaxID=157072 RepID=A0A024UR17_9STRA|nr:hypothetical protein H310_01161 [Aphanomyces invadans]ETW08620.1 hypothetical protein H310_01161 [Aphanomyces invadans]|eukprot:XP_008862425.1 hypothetical protein H310_01161 [Aphanomyces invadans]